MAADTRSSGRRRLGGLVRMLPYAIAGALLVLYFVWMMIEMSSQSEGGASVPAGIFGAVLLGVLAGGASLARSRRRQ